MTAVRFICATILLFAAAIPSVEAEDGAAKQLRLVKIIHPESAEKNTNPDAIDAHAGVFYWLQQSTGIHRFSPQGDAIGTIVPGDPSELMLYRQMDVSEQGILLVGDRARLLAPGSDKNWKNERLTAAYFVGSGFLWVNSKLGDPGCDLLTVVDSDLATIKVLEINPLGIETDRDFESDLFVEHVGGRLYLISPFRPLLIIHDLETRDSKEVEISCHSSQFDWLINMDYKRLRPPHLQGMSQTVRGMSIAGDRLYVCCEGRKLPKVFVYDLEGGYIERYFLDLEEAEIDGESVSAVLDMKVLRDEEQAIFFMLSMSGAERVVSIFCPQAE